MNISDYSIEALDELWEIVDSYFNYETDNKTSINSSSVINQGGEARDGDS
jgi:hypothetical protein